MSALILIGCPQTLPCWMIATRYIHAAKEKGHETIKVETNLVVSDVLVLNDKGNALIGLKSSDFIITDNGVPPASATNSFAVARPMPLFPPVMNAVLFASRTGASSGCIIKPICHLGHLVL